MGWGGVNKGQEDSRRYRGKKGDEFSVRDNGRRGAGMNTRMEQARAEGDQGAKTGLGIGDRGGKEQRESERGGVGRVTRIEAPRTVANTSLMLEDQRSPLRRCE